MKLKVGDKVKFLNQSGGGIVSKIVSSQVVNVAIEDGFDIPTMVKDLVKAEYETVAARMFDDERLSDKQTTYSKTIVEEDDDEDIYEPDRISPIKKYSANKQEDGIYLAFAPHDQQWLLTGDLDIYLLNHSNYDFIFSLLLQTETDEFTGQDYDALPSHSKILLATIGRDELPQWNRGIVQGVFQATKDTKVLAPLSTEFKIKEMRFLKEGNYIITPILSEKTFIVTLTKIAEQNVFINSSVNIAKDKTEANEIIPTKKARILDAESIIHQHKTNSNTAEVDLHIGELVDDYYMLDNNEILNIQLNYFEKYLNAAIIDGLQKVIFIHGVGVGTLKLEIIKKLKQYENLHWFDASMAKYGVGATEVLLSKDSRLVV